MTNSHVLQVHNGVSGNAMDRKIRCLRINLLSCGLDSIALSAIIFLLTMPIIGFFFFVGTPLFALVFIITVLAALWINRSKQTIFDGVSSGTQVFAIICFAVATLITLVGGGGRIFPITSDWLIRDAVLHDLVIRSWPFTYKFDGTLWSLRAPLGMYLGPALIGKLVCLYAAYVTLWLQNAIAIAFVLWLLCGGTKTSQSVTVLIVFCIFGGFDVVGYALFGIQPLKTVFQNGAYGGGIQWWNPLFQYSSTLTLAFWVPNHAIAGWFIAALVLMWDRHRIGLGLLAYGAALSVFWSPLPLMGALPFLLKAGVEAIWNRRLGWPDVATAALIVVGILPLLVYLACDSSAVANWLQAPTPAFDTFYCLFIGLEVFPFVAVNALYSGNRGGFSVSTYRLAVVTLLLIPFYHLGAANDFVMRASIPALAILAVVTGQTMWSVLQTKRKLPVILVAATLTIGAVTGFSQIWGILHSPFRGISTCDLIQAWDQQPASQVPKSGYLVPRDLLPSIFRRTPVQVYSTGPTTRRCSGEQL